MMSLGVMVLLLVLYLLVCDWFLWQSLQRAITASSVTVYQCVGKAVEEVESTSSDIKIESDDENGESGEMEDGNVMSTKSYKRRERVDTDEMEGNAGLEI